MAKLHVSHTQNKQLGFSINVKPLTLDSVNDFVIPGCSRFGQPLPYWPADWLPWSCFAPHSSRWPAGNCAWHQAPWHEHRRRWRPHSWGLTKHATHLLLRAVLRNANIAAAQSSSNELNVNGDGKHWQVYCFSKGEVEPESNQRYSFRFWMEWVQVD